MLVTKTGQALSFSSEVKWLDTFHIAIANLSQLPKQGDCIQTAYWEWSWPVLSPVSLQNLSGSVVVGSD